MRVQLRQAEKGRSTLGDSQALYQALSGRPSLETGLAGFVNGKRTLEHAASVDVDGTGAHLARNGSSAKLERPMKEAELI